MTKELKDAEDIESQLSLINVSKRWWHVCVILLCMQTLGWMTSVWWSVRYSAGSYRDVIEAMVYGSSMAIPLFIVLAITVPLVAESIGGLIVVLAEYLKHRLQKRFEKIGEERGVARANSVWGAWYKRMKEAEARGEPFDELPPSVGR